VTTVVARPRLVDVIDGADGAAVEDRALTDAALLAAVGAGDRYALAELYARHSPWLLLRLSRRCGDRGLVDEVLQDTFVAVWRRPGGWSGDGEFAAWLWGIAARRMVDGFRRRPAATVALSEGNALGTGRSAEEEALAAGEYGDVSTALETLPVDLRDALRVTVVDGLTTSEAAQRLGIPAGTVKTRVMRAKAVLRKALS
jgi:RNA polymerase sigma-70 factor (ECF subfamily)